MKNTRQIKFRCYDFDKKSFVSPSNIPIVGSCEDLKWSLTPEGKNVTFQQFTGLLDKNGKEIYEGDIVEIHYDNTPKKTKTIRVIRWKNTARYTGFDHGGDNPKRQVEIIGNIYENPDLLK